VVDQRARADRCLATLLGRHDADLAGLRAQVRALSPQATLDRGYAVVQRDAGGIVRDAATVSKGERLHARVATGTLHVVVESGA
jgi:exodeoxyribonuclease VII large subunit